MEDASDLVPGVDYPRTFQEVDEWFRSDAACREYIRRLRWPNGFICPHCGWTGEPWMTSRGLLHCQGCQGQTSLTAGTIFQDTRKPLRMWFMAMWYPAYQPIDPPLTPFGRLMQNRLQRAGNRIDASDHAGANGRRV